LVCYVRIFHVVVFVIDFSYNSKFGVASDWEGTKQMMNDVNFNGDKAIFFSKEWG